MNTKTKNIIWVVAALLVIVVLCVYPLMTIESEFGGADGAAGDLILEIDKDFEPWMEPVLSPPGGETESLMFCLQAALGSGVLCYCLGYLVASKKYKKSEK